MRPDNISNTAHSKQNAREVAQAIRVALSMTTRVSVSLCVRLVPLSEIYRRDELVVRRRTEPYHALFEVAHFDVRNENQVKNWS